MCVNPGSLLGNVLLQRKERINKCDVTSLP